ncbi:hypothetical protein [Nocardiopsis sp. FR4]|uniref:hypothetical protein n=1 Tax=Nocardiopsis sp. FR4 TaxID=2605985 RepID=UPI001F1F5B06|nr:hypothetical protein [Nocardiopsis sp. FR4]
MGHRTDTASDPLPEEPLTRREGRPLAFLTAALSMFATLTACSASEPENEGEGPPPDYVSESWVEREVMLHILDRMITENEPEEDAEKITGSQNALFEAGIIKETEDGYSVEFDKDEWRTEEVNGLSEVDGSLVDATNFDEVTWCGEPVGGRELVDTYMDEFWGTLDSHDAYTASIADYVDCGDGRP